MGLTHSFGSPGQLCSTPSMISTCSKAYDSWLAEFIIVLLLFCLAVVFSQRRLAGGWQSSLLGRELGRDQVNAKLHFYPESYNPWLNSELLPRSDGNRVVLQICLEMFIPQAGKCWRRIPGKEEWPFLFNPSSVGLFCKMQLLIPHNRKCRPKEHIVFISTY